MWRVLAAIGLIGFMASAAHAQSNEDVPWGRTLDGMQRTSAAPDAPVVMLGWRDGLMARLGIPIPLYVEDTGWAVRMDAAVELYNRRPENAFPFELWRGFFAARLGHRWHVDLDGVDGALSLFGALEHESDHETWSSTVPAFDTFLYTNAVAARGDLLVAWPEVALLVGLTARLHVVSCTDATLRCDAVEANGAQTGELALDASARSGSPRLDDGNVRFCAALHAGWIASAGRIVEEARAALSAGACLRYPSTGEWQLMADGFVGSDLGMHRAVTVVRAGASLRWTL